MKRIILSVLGLWFLCMNPLYSDENESDWMQYGGHEGGGRYSPLNQINKDNVHDLEVAWTFKTGHLDRVPERLSFLRKLVGFQVTPILLPDDVGGHLVLCTPFNEVIALDPTSGEQRWFYSPEINLMPLAGRFNCKGLSQWRDPKVNPDELCAHSLFMATNDKRLIALDGRTGTPCPGFGENGQVDVTPYIKALEPTNQIRSSQLKSPPAVVNGVIIIGGTGNKFKDASSINGAVRGFDARSGEFLWAFDTLVRDQNDPDALPYSVGGANVWTTMSVDSERDLVFVPTASASPNFYGG
ncbi:MAG TPA: pyrroloquinoline quinone-dependent dehydrogenase, partial [Gammaproteobacteria bacterium]|nr:pyrroloquinoline quinone-dependent dehydrogenase [Gammaproteobacteria bacterium]